MTLARNRERLYDQVISRLRVGVHWDTEVFSGNHRVCQVLCSALPVGVVKSVRVHDWTVFACTLLNAAYEATLAVAALSAALRGCRVKVYLTLLGGGVFGSRTEWVYEAIDRALDLFKSAPLDVRLVHHAVLPEDALASLEKRYGTAPPDNPEERERLASVTELQAEEL